MVGTININNNVYSTDYTFGGGGVLEEINNLLSERVH